MTLLKKLTNIAVAFIVGCLTIGLVILLGTKAGNYTSKKRIASRTKNTQTILVYLMQIPLCR